MKGGRRTPGPPAIVTLLVVAASGVGFAAATGAPRDEPGGGPRPGSTSAADRDADRGGLREEIVVVPGRRSTAPGAAVAHETRIERDDLRESPSLRLDDVLRSAATLDLFRRSSSRVAHPTTRGVTLRGLGPSGASRALVSLDDVPLNDPFGGWVHWGRIPSTALGAAVISPGGGSDTWGSSALAGTVRLASRPPGQPRLGAFADAGELRERRLALFAGGRTGGLDVGFDAERVQSDGHVAVGEASRGSIDIPAWSETTSFLARASAEISDRSRLALTANLFDERRGGGTPASRSEASGALLVLGRSTRGATGLWDVSLRAETRDFASLFTSQSADRTSERPALDQFDVPADAFGASARWSGLGDAGTTRRAGLDVVTVDAATHEAYRFVDDGSGGRFTRRRDAGGETLLAGLWGSEVRSLGPRTELEASARVDLWRVSGGRRVETDVDTGGALTDLRFGARDAARLSPRIGVSHRANGAVRLTAAAYGAFRAPTLNELFRPFRVRVDVTEANPALRPERLAGLEGGLRVERGRGRFRMTAFANRVDDFIANVTIGPGPGTVGPCAFVPAGGVCRQRANAGRALLLGVETDARLELGRGFSASGALLVTRATWREAPGRPELDGRRLPQVPSLRFTGGIEAGSADRLAARVTVRAEGRRAEDDLGLRELAGYGVVDLRLERRLGEHASVSLAVENLFDREIETAITADGVVSVGTPRVAMLGLRLAGAGNAR